ncbi:MAG: hypothetical protein LBC75_10170 [Fibromonadaceae bacterium]|jgi:hypothetical protein|nr:hypothetical protein [Fibromonadaceae bacterium]
MKTFFINCLLSCGAAFLLLACDSFGSTEARGTAFNVQYTRHTRSLEFTTTTTVISSKNEIEEYYGKRKIKICDKQGEVWYEQEDYNTIEKYTDDYFADGFLVIVELWEPSSSIRHKVEKIDKNGDIVINRLVPRLHVIDDMWNWGIIIELNNHFKVELFQTVFFDTNYLLY